MKKLIILLAGTSLGASGASALAQTTSQPSAAIDTAAEDVSIQDIVVTGSRIVRDGYEAPTPVTVLTSENLMKAVPSSLGESLRTMPALQNSLSPNSGNHANSNSANHGNYLNLRNLGPERVLVMLDGLRIPSTSFAGLVDTNIIPDLLVQRVDIVTGGASAAYGSDAVSGVVNFILDKNFTGIRGLAQAGMTTRGDAENYRVGAAGGFKIGESAHMLLAVSASSADEIKASQRDHSGAPCGAVGANPNSGAAGTALNPLVIRCNLRYGFAGQGGIVGANAGRLTGMTFNRDGSFVPYASVQGAPTGTAGTTIGDGPGFIIPNDYSIGAGIKTRSAFARFSIELGNTEFYAQGLYSHQETRYSAISQSCVPCTIFTDNAFVPAAARSLLVADGITSFKLNRQFTDFGSLPVREKTDFYMATAGAAGSIGSRWKWDLNYTYGRAKTSVRQKQWVNERFWAAIDAVRDPATGNIVCQVSLTPSASLYPGCVPINIMGPGNVSQAGYDYIQGFGRYTAVNQTNDVVGTISGQPFDLWAGPLAIVLGAQYRDAKLDFNGNGDPNDPPAYTGLRTPRSGDAAAQRFFFLNIGRTHGAVKVKEGFGEVALPLLKSDDGFIEAIDANGAFRVTDYSTSGTVKTWKLGATLDFGGGLSGLRLRSTRSRDIRAPFLNDLFRGRSVAQSNITDPHTNTSGGGLSVSGGNPDLDPEIGDTFTVGAVYQPDYFPGFSVSLDYWKIKLREAIGTQTISNMLIDCELSNGTADVCDLIVRPFPFENRTAENRPISVLALPQNLAKQRKEGIDLDMSYRTELGGGNLSAQLFASYIFKDISQSSRNAIAIDTAGEGVVPHLSASLNIGYSTERWEFFVNERMVGPHGFSATEVYREPDIPAVFYTNATVTHKLKIGGGSQDLFLTATNLFDRKPPLQPGTGVAITYPSPGALYDIVGRRITAGVKMRF